MDEPEIAHKLAKMCENRYEKTGGRFYCLGLNKGKSHEKREPSPCLQIFSTPKLVFDNNIGTVATPDVKPGYGFVF